MTYDLYFHNDFDGHASAAIMFSFLTSRGDTVSHFVPVDHDLQSQWVREGFFKEHHLFTGKRNRPVVMDFPFHPGTAFWFDHHPTAFKKEAWQRAFRPDKAHAYDPNSPSCCHFAYRTLVKNFGWRPPEHFKELIGWLDVIDGAGYASAQQTILMKEPALVIDAYLEAQKRGEKQSAWFIKLLAEKSLNEIAKIPKIAAAGKRARQRAIRNLAFYRKHLVVRGNVTIIDLMKNEDKALRYAPYYLLPKVRYSIREMMKGRFYYLSVTANPWLMTEAGTRLRGGVHIGTLLKRYGGGGHKDAGGVEFETREAAMRAVEEIVVVLNGNQNAKRKDKI